MGGIVDPPQAHPVEEVHFFSQHGQHRFPRAAFPQLDVAEAEAAEGFAVAAGEVDDFVGGETPGLDAEGAQLFPVHVVEDLF